ncbi:hypothetical protein NQ317_009672 [Molorchus minor]|uniref:Gustatory receptor n=1 Tax=Molorchus minor TaxID=1323400 RepID=A0ABQ9JGT6_9CUCU|nr:hypothetical protein NQ317_009672 [Molorchus minor]
MMYQQWYWHLSLKTARIQCWEIFIQVEATLLWVFNDLFIILMSTALALRFKQITSRLAENQNKFHMKNQCFWEEIREDYDRLSILCRELDNHISYIVLLSFTLNIFILLVQLYHSLETVTGFVGKLYFVYSFVYLIIKVVSVSLYAAWINDESLAPASILNSVPSSVYNIEVKYLLIK